MANVQIGSLPTYTGDTTGVYLVMNDSGNTTTYKTTKETLVRGVIQQDNLTKIPQQMVWDSRVFSDPNSRFQTSGGLMIDYQTTNQVLTSGVVYVNTILLNPGQILTEMMFHIPAFTTTSTFNIGLFSLVPVVSNNATSYRLGTLLHTIASGLSITGTGDKKITSINYTASDNITDNNVYGVALFQNGGCSVQFNSSNQLIPHVMGGELVTGIFYRRYIRNINGLSSTTIVSDLSTYSITAETSPGWYFVYKTQ